jgi:hypothetical protein
MPERERRLELVQALVVAPFISADESLVCCRQGAEEIEALIRENDALQKELADAKAAITKRWLFEARL